MHRQDLSTFTYANQVELIRGGKIFFQRLKSLIEEARETIYFQFYIFDGDSTGEPIAQALKAAALRGVKVNVLFDGYASLGLSSAFVQDLRDAGIRFRWFKSYFKHRRFYVGRRLHHKVVVVDSVKAFVCGLNVSDRYNDTPESIAWLDWALYSEGVAALRLEQVCKRRINDYSNNSVTPHAQETGLRCAVRICVNDWVARRTEVTRSYLQLIKESNSRLIIMSPYFMPGRTFRKALRQAIKRGVQVQIILAGVSDIFVSKFAERYMYTWLLNLNIEIFEYQRNVLHGKMIVSDGERVSVGSYNINNLSAYASIELNVEVKNEKFASNTEKQLISIMQDECVQITKEIHARKTNLIDRILQVAAYNFLRLMLLVFAFKQRG